MQGHNPPPVLCTLTILFNLLFPPAAYSSAAFFCPFYSLPFCNYTNKYQNIPPPKLSFSFLFSSVWLPLAPLLLSRSCTMTELGPDSVHQTTLAHTWRVVRTWILTGRCHDPRFSRSSVILQTIVSHRLRVRILILFLPPPRVPSLSDSSSDMSHHPHQTISSYSNMTSSFPALAWWARKCRLCLRCACTRSEVVIVHCFTEVVVINW